MGGIQGEGRIEEKTPGAEVPDVHEMSMKKLLLLHGEFVYADLGVGVSRIQDD